MGEPVFTRAEHVCVNGRTKFFHAVNCIDCVRAECERLKKQVECLKKKLKRRDD